MDLNTGISILHGLGTLAYFIVMGVLAFKYFVTMLIFKKAGIEEWKAWIPFYNTACMFKVAGYSESYFFLYLLAFIPGVGTIAVFVINAFLSFKVTKRFTESDVIAILAIFFGFIVRIIIAFSKEMQYIPINKNKERSAYEQFADDSYSE